MVLAGALRAGVLLRFVPRAVMVGFITGVGVNIILGQLGNFTGYEASGANRVLRTLNLGIKSLEGRPPDPGCGCAHAGADRRAHQDSARALGLVVAVVVGSAVAAAFSHVGHQIATVGDVTTLPNGLPMITAPLIREIPGLLVPAVALAFVGMVQGAGVSAAFPNPDGSPSSASRDFIAQGTGSILSGLFQGMPAGGSMSATALAVQAGARTRLALFIAGGVMACVILVALALSATSRSLRWRRCSWWWATARSSRPTSGPSSRAGQYRPRSCRHLRAHRADPRPSSGARRRRPRRSCSSSSSSPTASSSNSCTSTNTGTSARATHPTSYRQVKVVLLQPFGSLFFASATTFNEALPAVTADTKHSVVILRLRGIDDLGVSITNVVVRPCGRPRRSGLETAGQRGRATARATRQERRSRPDRRRQLLPRRCLARKDAPQG